jgi:hypothetical protein
MTKKKKRTLRNKKQEDPSDEPMAGSEPTPLDQQVGQYAMMAHEANQECQEIADAQEEMTKRRNRSAQ